MELSPQFKCLTPPEKVYVYSEKPEDKPGNGRCNNQAFYEDGVSCRQLHILRKTIDIRHLEAFLVIANNIVSLKLIGNELTTVPSNIAFCKQLRIFDFNNEIRQQSVEFGEIKDAVNLTELSICNVDLNDERFRKNIENLRNLRSVRLQSCDLKSLPVSPNSHRYVMHLDLHKNNISSIPDRDEYQKWFCRMRDIDLSENPLGEFPRALVKKSRAVQLRTLNLSGCKLASIPENIMTLCRMDYLDVSNNNIQALPASLLHCVSMLKKLDCQGNPCVIENMDAHYLENDGDLKVNMKHKRNSKSEHIIDMPGPPPVASRILQIKDMPSHREGTILMHFKATVENLEKAKTARCSFCLTQQKFTENHMIILRIYDYPTQFEMFCCTDNVCEARKSTFIYLAQYFDLTTYDDDKRGGSPCRGEERPEVKATQALPQLFLANSALYTGVYCDPRNHFT